MSLFDQTTQRKQLSRLLGEFQTTHFALQTRRPIVQAHGSIRAESLELIAPTGETVRGILTGPDRAWTNLPAVLYCHAHGNRYAMGANELLEGRPSLYPESYAQAFARLGIVALSIDMPCFGLRSEMKESELSKKRLFCGKTLFGQMLNELSGGLDFLSHQPGVDPLRIGVFGFSMGATQAFWLGALEPRLRAIAHTCSFADLATLVASGAHDLHGLYMTVPNLLSHVSTGEIAGLIAPRPQLACLGLLDPLTPPEAVEPALQAVKARYADANAQDCFMAVISKDTGHMETEEMRVATLEFFSRWL